MVSLSTKDSCNCVKCISVCYHHVGWFFPNEIQPAAEHLGLTVKDLFKRFLGIDYWVGENEIFVLAPALAYMEPRTIYPYKPWGHCIFLTAIDTKEIA